MKLEDYSSCPRRQSRSVHCLLALVPTAEELAIVLRGVLVAILGFKVGRTSTSCRTPRY